MSELSEEEIIKTLEEIIQKNQQVVKEAYKNKDINTMQLVADIDNEAIAIQGLLDLYNKEKEKNKNLLDNLNHCIRSSVIKERLGIEENISEEQMLDYIDILVSENARLEDIEDKKVQIEYQNVFNKGIKSVEKKIREKIEELEKIIQKEEEETCGRCITIGKWEAIKYLQELLEERN